MSNSQDFNVNDTVDVVFSKTRHPDIGQPGDPGYFKIGADDKTHRGTIVLVQDNGNCTIEFKQGDREMQISVPGSEVKLVKKA